MSEPPTSLGLYARGEAGARLVVILVGAGVGAFTVGGFVVSAVSGWAVVESPTAAFVVAWGLQRLWLWLVLPALGLGAGRILTVSPNRFALTAGLTGELYGVLIASAGDGLEAVFLDWLDVLARVATLALGLWVTAKAVGLGRAAALRAQAKVEAIAQRNAAEYAEMAARAAREPQPPVSPGSVDASGVEDSDRPARQA